MKIKEILATITENITKLPSDFFPDFWSKLLKIGASAVMPFALTLLGIFLASELYKVYCKSNGALDLQLVSTTFIKFIIPYFIVIKTYDFLDLICGFFNKMILKISSGIDMALPKNISNSQALIDKISSMNFFDKIAYMVQLSPISNYMSILSLVVTVIVYGRLIEITLYWIFAPIPLATLVHDEYSQIGKNFLKLFCSLLLQGAFMLLSVGIWVAIVTVPLSNADIAGSWQMLAWTAVLVFALLKSGSLAKRLLGTF